MAKEVKYYIVAANALPEIFIKVAEAKRMMQTGHGGPGYPAGRDQPQCFL